MDTRSSMLWNILTVMVMAATAVVLLIYGIIFFQPNVGFNVFAPDALPEKIVLVTDTATVQAFRSITPTTYFSPTYTVTITTTPTITLSPTISQTPTITETPTITGTPPTATLSPTISRTATRTTNPAVLTQWAGTRIAETKTKAVDLTSQAGTRYKLTQTGAVERTQEAIQTQTAQSGELTATYAIGTATQSAIETATMEVIMTSTEAVAQTSTSTAITQEAVQTRTEQADIELNLPIAYSVDTNGNTETAEQYITQKLIDGSIQYTLNMSASYPGARAATGWSMSDTNNHYLLFSDGNATSNPIYRVLYTTIVTIENLANQMSNYIDDVVVNRQSGNFQDRTLAFSYAAGGLGTDRNLWVMSWDTGLDPDGWGNTQLTGNNSIDEHSPHWITDSGTGYDGEIMYVAGPAGDPENIRVIPSSGGSSVPMTFYDSFSTREISSPKWCTGYDWENEETIHRVIFGMRTSASDDWDLYLADPMVQFVEGNNDQIIRLTDSPGINEWAPDWSPFCNRVTYLSDVGGNTNVWTYSVAPDGTLSDNIRLTNNGFTQMCPLWQPYKP